MALHNDLDRLLRGNLGAAGYTVTGTSATVSGTLDPHQLSELIGAAATAKHDVKMVAGVLTVAPRTNSG